MNNQNDNPQMYKPIYVYANQKIITVKELNFTEPYGQISRQAERLASKTLRCYPPAYMLYIHFALHQEGYTFGLSPRDISNEIGLSQPQYNKSIKVLIEHGYLVPNDRYEHGYDFYAIPQNEHTETITDTDIHTDSDTVCQQITPISSPQNESIPFQIPPLPTQNEYAPPQAIGRNNTINNTINKTINITKDNTNKRTINITKDIIEDRIIPTDEEINCFIEERGFRKRYDEGILKIDDNYQELTKEEFIECYFQPHTATSKLLDDDLPF